MADIGDDIRCCHWALCIVAFQLFKKFRLVSAFIALSGSPRSGSIRALLIGVRIRDETALKPTSLLSKSRSAQARAKSGHMRYAAAESGSELSCREATGTNTMTAIHGPSIAKPVCR
jgi:hypothetical protein